MNLPTLPSHILDPAMAQAREEMLRRAFRDGFAEAVYIDALRLADALIESAADLFAGQDDLFDIRRQETSAAIKRALGMAVQE